jgi:hypothetical protein
MTATPGTTPGTRDSTPGIRGGTPDARPAEETPVVAGATAESREAPGPVATGSRRVDSVCAAAVELARAAAVETGGERVGAHLAVIGEGERLVTHLFEAAEPGYAGWRWSVTLARAPRAKVATVCEVALLPGSDALLAPEWVPWSERLRPGDLGVGDILPTDPDDDRLAPAYVASDDPAVEDTAFELGLGRVRVMSRLGRLEAAERWYGGDQGPTAPIASHAPAPCATCGFWLPLAGSLRSMFGVCANLFAPDDGKVVSADHGCGAHSEALVQATVPIDVEVVLDDDAELEVTPRADRGPGSVDDAETVEPFGHG